MSNYYNMRDAKVSIAHELMEKGWKVYGYHADKSDSMTDYYSPAHWDGIATKNGYILVVDQRTGAEQREIKKYNYNSQSITDRKKIEKLQEMTVARGCTEAEEENAKAAIEKIMNKESEGIAEYEVVDVIPAYMANPGRCKWHIEKDGKIYDKGTGLTKFADLEKTWIFDYNTMEYKDSYKRVREWNHNTNDWEYIERKPSEELIKLTETFNNLIARIENVASGVTMTGDGTEETEKAGLEAESKKGYEKVIKKVKKTSLKMVEIERDHFQVGDYITLSHHGHYWKITSEYMQKGTWKGVKDSRKAFVYEIVGSEKRGFQQLKNPKRYYDYEERMLKSLEEGKIKIFELKEVTEVVEVEKWEKIDKSKNTYNNEKTTAPEKKETKTDNKEEVKTSKIGDKIEYTIAADTDTRDNSPLWVVKIVNTLDKEEFKKVVADMKKLKGYYSRFKGGFIFRYDPSEVLEGQSDTVETKETTKTEKKQQINIKEIALEITDESTDLILELNLNSNTYPTNEEYKILLAEYINKHNIYITDELLQLIEFEGLKSVLESIRDEKEKLLNAS